MSAPRREFPPAPTTARALLIQAHPRTASFNHALGEAWADGARAAGVPVDVVVLSELDFDPLFDDGQKVPLAADLLRVQRLIAEAGHISVAYPVWWGSVPALLKGFFDQTFQTGWAYGRDDSGGYIKGLAGRSGRLLVTMDAPGWYDRLLYGRSAIRQVRDATFKFTGIAPAKVSAFTSIEKTSAADREGLLAKARATGAADAKALLRRLPAAREQLTAQAS